MNPYSLPIVSVPWPVDINTTRAFLVPILPATVIGEEQKVQNLGYECIDPLCMETPLSPIQILTIGREPESTLFINYHAVSRQHAEIINTRGYYLLRDLGSRNGTFLNDQRLEPLSVHILNANDKIRIGNVITYTLQLRPVSETREEIKYLQNE